MMGRARAFACALAGAVFAHAAALAQDKPAGIRRDRSVIIAVAPGAGGDAMARAAAQMLNEPGGRTPWSTTARAAAA